MMQTLRMAVQRIEVIPAARFGQRLIIAAVLALGPLPGCSSIAATDIPSIETRYDAFYALSSNSEGLTQRELATRIAKMFQSEFAGRDDITLLDSASADFMFRAGYISVFYTREATGLAEMVHALARLEQLGVARPQHYSDMLSAFVITRQLERATALSSSGKAVNDRAVPNFADDASIPPGVPTEWLVDPVKNEIRRQPFVIPQTPFVLVVSSPKCAFSRQAFEDISRDSTLRKDLIAHSRWISPVEGKIDIAAFQAWNSSHPDAAISIANAHRDYPFVDHWATPTFYFLNRGQVVAKVVGWPKGGRIGEIERAMQLIGLRDSQ